MFRRIIVSASAQWQPRMPQQLQRRSRVTSRHGRLTQPHLRRAIVSFSTRSARSKRGLSSSAVAFASDDDDDEHAHVDAADNGLDRQNGRKGQKRLANVKPIVHIERHFDHANDASQGRRATDVSSDAIKSNGQSQAKQSRLEALRQQLRIEDQRRGSAPTVSSSSPSSAPSNSSAQPSAKPAAQPRKLLSKLPPIPSIQSVQQQMQAQTQAQTQTKIDEQSSADNIMMGNAPITVQEEWIRQLEALPDPSQTKLHQSHADAPANAVLQDTFGRQHSYLRISLSEKCNLRCLYCMPEDGVPLQPPEHLLSNNEIIQLVDWFVTVGGVTKLRFTGGEPLLRKDIVSLISQISERHKDKITEIGITTNGVTLSKHLPGLIDAGVTHINVSLDSLQPHLFATLTRRPESYFHRVWQAIQDCADQAPHLHTKINCVVMKDNVHELPQFAHLSNQLGIDIRFIEYMPFNDNRWGTNDFISYQDMQDIFQDQQPSTGHALQRLQDGPNDTTKWWSYNPVDLVNLADQHLDHDSRSVHHAAAQQQQPQPRNTRQGRIGFITSMSSHFCGTCNRLRMTADGQLKVCLFGATEISLRDILRIQRPDLLAKVVHAAVQRKHFKLGGHHDMQDISDHSSENRPMTLIGG